MIPPGPEIGSLAPWGRGLNALPPWSGRVDLSGRETGSVALEGKAKGGMAAGRAAAKVVCFVALILMVFASKSLLTGRSKLLVY